LFIEKSY